MNNGDAIAFVNDYIGKKAGSGFVNVFEPKGQKW
jgi:hypothetical protein